MKYDKTLSQISLFFLLATFSLISSPVFAFSSSETITHEEVLNLLKKINFPKVVHEYGVDWKPNYEERHCLDHVNPGSQEKFQTLMKYFTPKNLAQQLVRSWAESEENRKLTITVRHLTGGAVDIDFDEGLGFEFSKDGTLAYIDYWNHYSSGSTDTYKKFFDHVPGFVSWYETHIYFKGPCQGNVDH